MTYAAYGRIERSESMPGLIVVPQRMAIGQAIDELIFLAKESIFDEWESQVIWLPL
jgi:hypothetical protein